MGDAPAFRRRRAVLATRAARMLAEAPAAPHRVADVARALDVSAFHLAHVFRAFTGTSIHQYLLQLRMQIAIERLRSGETSLSRLALDLGFSSHSHFSATFRKRFGTSPTYVRAGLQSQNASFGIMSESIPCIPCPAAIARPSVRTAS